MMAGIISTSEIKDNYERVIARIQQAAKRSGRSPDAVKLVVVTKKQPLEVILPVIEAGARCLGENYAEEAVPKIQALSAQEGIEWHMIGHVQSRKSNLVSEHFSYLHSLDSLKLAARLDHFAGLSRRRLPCLLECNVSGEESKFGFPAWRETEWESLLLEFRQIACFPNLELRGLMTMAPYYEVADKARPNFRLLARLSEFLHKNMPDQDWSELSMGMSGDFEVAIEEGATWVRIGTSILGSRK